MDDTTSPDSHTGAPPDTSPDITVVTGSAPDNPDGAWLEIPAAIARLGVTERTVRRYIDAGKLEHRRRGGRIEVWVAGVTSLTGTAPDPAVTALAIVDRVNDLVSQQTIPLVQALNDRDAIIREQSERIGRLEAQLEAARVVPDTDRRPWWRRVFG